MNETEQWAKGGKLAEILSSPHLDSAESRPWWKRSGIFLLGLFLVVILIVLLWTCGHSSSIAFERAKEGTEHFHEQFNQGDYAGIYSQASEEFQDAGSEEDMAKFLGKVHEKLGDFSNTNGPKSYFVTASTSGLFITLTYASNFAAGRGDELFVWRVGTRKAELVKYTIDSKELVLK